jgi:restriction system protein
MAKRHIQPARSRSRRSSQPFLEKGMAALLLGGIMWVPSLLSVSSPILKMVAQSIRTPALFAMGMGALLLATHGVLQFFKRRNEALPPKVEPVLVQQPATPAQPASATPAPAKPQAQPPAQPPTEWSMDVLAVIEWRRFEALVETLFAQAGFETRSQSHGADGGVDIWLHSKNAEGPVAVVQCKHWQGKAVGVREVREFFGVMASHSLKRGTYATSSVFTGEALAFAKANGINAMDGDRLLQTIRSRTAEQQAELLKVATEGEYWRPTCASCGVKMIPRQPRAGGKPFWGCQNYPTCRSTLPMKDQAA